MSIKTNNNISYFIDTIYLELWYCIIQNISFLFTKWERTEYKEHISKNLDLIWPIRDLNRPKKKVNETAWQISNHHNMIFWTLGSVPEPHFLDAGNGPRPWSGPLILTSELFCYVKIPLIF